MDEQHGPDADAGAASSLIGESQPGLPPLGHPPASSLASATASPSALIEHSDDSDNVPDSDVMYFSEHEMDDYSAEDAAAEIDPTEYVADGSQASLTAFPSAPPIWTSPSTMDTPAFISFALGEACWVPNWVEDAQPQAARIRALLVDLFPRLWHLPQDPNITVRFMAQGKWNRAFVVELPGPPQADTDAAIATGPDALCGRPEPMVRRLVFRIALPVMPSAKTRSEVATMRWVRENTTIPVPRVFLYDPSYKNPVGYEWILMDLMPGKTFCAAQESMDVQKKRKLATTVAEWVHSLSQHRFASIGSLYHSSDLDGSQKTGGPAEYPSVVLVHNLYPTVQLLKQGEEIHSRSLDVRLGPVCSPIYGGDWRAEYNVSRGPFNNLQDWSLSSARISLQEVNDSRQYQRALLNHISEQIYDQTAAIKRAKRKGKAPAAYQHRVDVLASLKERLAKLVEELKGNPLARVSDAAVTLRHWPDFIARLQGPGDNGVAAVDEGDLFSHVSLHGSSYRYNRLEAHQAAAAKLVRLIKDVVPSSPFPPQSTSLVHWNISVDNVLVDPATGLASALLDWEQLFTRPRGHDSTWPPSLLYPPRVLEYIPHVEKEPSLSWVAPDEIAGFQTVWERQEMEQAYRQRLDQLSGVKPARSQEPSLECCLTSLRKQIVQKVVNLTDNYWIDPDSTEELVEAWESFERFVDEMNEESR